MAEREAPGDFDYLFDDPVDPAEVDEVTVDAHAPEGLDDDQWDEPDGNFWDRDAQPADDGQFDAFNTNTWYFRPAPTPWYRTKQAMTALIAAAAAMAAIVVSVVLLVFQAPDNSDDDHDDGDPDRADERTERHRVQRGTATAAPTTAADRRPRRSTPRRAATTPGRASGRPRRRRSG